MSCHLFHHVNDRYVVRVLNNSLVQGSDHILHHPKLVKQLATSLQHLVTKDVLLTIDPQVGESLLSRVQYFGQVAQSTLLVQHLVRFRKLVTVAPSCTLCLEYFAEALDLVKETFAGTLTILRVQVILVVCALLKVVRHHNCVL